MNKDFVDLLRAFVAAEVRFLIVGAYALALHGRPRATGDLDLWVEATPENAERIMGALAAFGAPVTTIRRRRRGSGPRRIRTSGPPVSTVPVILAVGVEFGLMAIAPPAGPPCRPHRSRPPHRD